MKPTFFRTAGEFREWLAAHHATASELLVGFRRKDSGKASITYPEALDEALCFGWIDGVRKSRDATSYTIRFSPRRPKSNWSRVNIDRVAMLTQAGRMAPSGLDAFARRDDAPGETRPPVPRTHGFDAASEREIRANKRAWAFLQTLPAWARRNAAFWVTSAKREETRSRRLASLIEHLEEETTPPALLYRPRTGRKRR